MRSVARRATKIGCCGFPTRHSEYYQLFRVVELQSTFYNLPKSRTAERWRNEAGSDFEFCMKAWQVITHPATSPTWRRISRLSMPRKRTRYGHLRPTRENFDAWDKTLEICRILNVSVCLIQCPPSFGLSRTNIDNARRFFGEIDRGNAKLAWEPRGNWKEHPVEIKKLCEKLDLIHAVDILRSEPVVETETCYFRLHGLGARELNYRYNYTAKDLERLRGAALRTLGRGAEQVFIMFNNLSMLENARSFTEMMCASRKEPNS